VPSRMSLREFRPTDRPQVQIAYARAWEALVATHAEQLGLFVTEFASRLPVLDAVDLYFRVVAIPDPMIEAARTRALTALDLDALPPRAHPPAITGWQRLRLDLVLDALQFRREYHRRTLGLARMVGARAAEAVLDTHVRNALGFARLLRRIMTVDRAVSHYVREFSLPLTAAQAATQRARAILAAEALAAQHAALPHERAADGEHAWDAAFPAFDVGNS
jgi:hypothetical protein